ncbi:hypothetical protein GQX74_002700 [Glossina fuscipes]|nr:hypothetical protein GQX74_002700 [Glossina fuscipes]
MRYYQLRDISQHIDSSPLNYFIIAFAGGIVIILVIVIAIVAAAGAAATGVAVIVGVDISFKPQTISKISILFETWKNLHLSGNTTSMGFKNPVTEKLLSVAYHRQQRSAIVSHCMLKLETVLDEM